MKREGDEVPFRMEYDMNGHIQPVEVVLREVFIQGTQIVLRGFIDREKVIGSSDRVRQCYCVPLDV